MGIIIESVHMGAVKLIRPQVFPDNRGFFFEAFKSEEYARHGLPASFVQENHSASTAGVVRGLHFQWDPMMSKLMRVTNGSAFLVAVDIRKGSPTLGEWFGTEVSAENKLQLYAPPGFARGFCVLSDYAEIQYMCTGTYNNKCESGILWNDPDIGIDWPLKGEPNLSEKDENAQTLSEWLKRPESDNFIY